MKDIFRSFNDTERKRLRQLLLILGVSLVFLFLVSLRERRSFHRLEDTLAGQKAALAKLDAARSSAVSEGTKWEQAVKDLETLKADRFYQDKDGVNVLRLDLQQLFSESGIMARAIKFDYADLDKERSRKVTVTFNFTGSYPLLKKFSGHARAVPQVPLPGEAGFREDHGRGEQPRAQGRSGGLLCELLRFSRFFSSWRRVVVLRAASRRRPSPAPGRGSRREGASLVRMDLLEPRPSTTAAPGRNIFAPQAAQPGRPVSVAPGNPLPGGLPAGGLGEAAVVPGAPSEAAAPPAFSIDLRFIGLSIPRRPGRSSDWSSSRDRRGPWSRARSWARASGSARSGGRRSRSCCRTPRRGRFPWKEREDEKRNWTVVIMILGLWGCAGFGRHYFRKGNEAAYQPELGPRHPVLRKGDRRRTRTSIPIRPLSPGSRCPPAWTHLRSPGSSPSRGKRKRRSKNTRRPCPMTRRTGRSSRRCDACPPGSSRCRRTKPFKIEPPVKLKVAKDKIELKFTDASLRSIFQTLAKHAQVNIIFDELFKDLTLTIDIAGTGFRGGRRLSSAWPARTSTGSSTRRR